MSSYPAKIRRCQHIKVNGTQCGSPALREEKCCYFHMRWRGGSKFAEGLRKENSGLPILEDANSIQVGLAEVMFHLVTQEIDHRTAALMLYALQTASANLRMTSFEPEPTRVVIDQECVERRPLGASAWSKVEGREYDDLTEDAQDKESNEGKRSWTAGLQETPENERLLPGESQRDRYIRVQKQKGVETEGLEPFPI
jgi:hypothetical protein